MDRCKKYRVPDVIDIIYDDVVFGLYSSRINRDNRILIAKLNIACDFLMNSSLSEQIIIDKLDFYDLDKFREQFSDYLGISPELFRSRFGQLD